MEIKEGRFDVVEDAIAYGIDVRWPDQKIL
jgi:hypothetical protein